MEYTTLGNTDIQISKLCVGCMSFGKAGTMHDWTLDETETEKVVKHALSLGINFFDTANGYSAGTSEEYLGRAIHKNIARDKVVIASKVYFNPGRLSAGEIADHFSITPAAVSRHLSVLKDADLIWDTREGKFIFYELNTSVLEEIMLWLTDLKGGAAP